MARLCVCRDFLRRRMDHHGHVEPPVVAFLAKENLSPQVTSRRRREAVSMSERFRRGPNRVTVLVVGAGPTGLLLASELHRRRVGCRLIDAHPAPLHWDRATVVHPRSLEVFESLGLLEPFLAAGVKQRMARLHSEGSVLGEIDLSICGSRHGFNIGISEEVTEAILTDYLHGHGGEIVGSSRLVELKADESDLSRRSHATGRRSRSRPSGSSGATGSQHHSRG